MKNIILLTIICLTFSCKAQTIVNLDAPGTYAETGKYYKDIDNILDPFVGTYLYTNGNTSFKIELRKKVNSSFNDVYFEDMLIGGYQYIENGVEKANTLATLDQNLANGYFYTVRGNTIMTGQVLGQTDALPNEKWIFGSIKDSSNGSVHRLFIRKVMVGSQEAIKIFIKSLGARAVTEGTPAPPQPNYPTYEYITLIKQ